LLLSRKELGRPKQTADDLAVQVIHNKRLVQSSPEIKVALRNRASRKRNRDSVNYRAFFNLVSAPFILSSADSLIAVIVF
jgi:hypothetical protein